MRAVIGSQWSERSSGVAWEKRGRENTRRAAEFWMSWSGRVADTGRPARRELQ
ncbi:UNVERIFIED_CONTAM: hypothetical protein FKN15_051133 [Acipenser sinensis]